MSEQQYRSLCVQKRVYQAFRWWGVGTPTCNKPAARRSLSSVPVVGCRNTARLRAMVLNESIKRSGGGVSEQSCLRRYNLRRVYQAFRWWGVGTDDAAERGELGVYQAFRWWGVGTPAVLTLCPGLSLSSVPVVGCRNYRDSTATAACESIKRSGGGVSEHVKLIARLCQRVYQAFRWWGVGTGGRLAWR